MGFQKDLSFQFESQVFPKFQNLGFMHIILMILFFLIIGAFLNNLILTTF